MDKKGLFFFMKVLIILIIVLVIAGIAAGIYFYNYYVYKTLRVCIPVTGTDLKINCASSSECTSIMNNISGFQENMKKLQTAPEFVKAKIDLVLSKMMVCESTCKAKQSYGDVFVNKSANFQSCKPGEDEVTLAIHGTEALQLLKYAKANPGILTA